MKIDENDNNTYITCKICGKKFGNITRSHLTMHGINSKIYKEKFGYKPDEPLASINYRKNVAVTKNRMIKRYGAEDGIKRWELYREKQRLTNLYDYKHEKYGWSVEDFKKYNLSRAVTYENMVKRYGNKEGLKRWNKYCNTQKYAGSCLEWFIKKHGYIEGQKKWNEICKAKSNTLDNFILRYGKEIGLTKYQNFCNSKRESIPYSAVSQILFEDITNNLNNKHGIYYHKYRNNEYGCYLHNIKRYVFLDYYDINTNKCIEFYGDYWHCNPLKYTMNYFHEQRNMYAWEIWEYDKIKNDNIKQEFNTDILIIWENDYITNKDLTINKCKEFLNYER